MNRAFRRALTVIGTGGALLGAVAAAHAARPAPITSPPLRPLQSTLAAQRAAAGKLTTEVQQTERQDAQARAQVANLRVSVAVTRADMKAAQAAAAAAAKVQPPVVQATTGASGGGGHDDDGGGGGDD